MTLYSQTKGNGTKYIIFFHGNSQSLECWDAVIAEKSLNNYSLVTVDLPGHGKSDRSLKPELEYTLKGMGAQILGFISGYQEFDYIIVACSIATNFIAEIALGLYNCKGLFFIGPCIIEEGFTVTDILLPNPNLKASFAQYPTDGELDLLIDDIAYCLTEDMRQKSKNTFLRTDPLFRSTLADAIAAEEWSDEIKNIENSGILTAVVYGKNEKINHVDYLDRSTIKKWQEKILLIPSAGHFAQLDQPGIIAGLIREFAADCLDPEE